MNGIKSLEHINRYIESLSIPKNELFRLSTLKATKTLIYEMHKEKQELEKQNNKLLKQVEKLKEKKTKITSTNEYRVNPKRSIKVTTIKGELVDIYENLNSASAGLGVTTITMRSYLSKGEHIGLRFEYTENVKRCVVCGERKEEATNFPVKCKTINSYKTFCFECQKKNKEKRQKTKTSTKIML